MDERKTLVIATRNKGKTAEIRQMLSEYPVEIKDLNDFGPIPEIEEDGETFDENAYKKSSFASRVLGFPALADDSGLCVKALEGRPGVHSARFAGKDSSDEEKCAKLLEMMKNAEDRSAEFVCVISIAVPTGAALTYEGRCEGLIAKAPEGENGFGYDPVFYYPPLEKTFARLDPEEKNKVSHRGQALRQVREEFGRVLKWLDLQMPVPEKFSCNHTDRT